MNKTIIDGNLTAAPEVRQAAGETGSSVATFTVAVNRRTRNGERVADFIRCVCFGRTAETAAQYLEKGRHVLVEGHIQTGSYEKDGQRRYTTDVVVERLQFLGGRGSAAAGSGAGAAEASGFLDVSDEEIPF